MHYKNKRVVKLLIFIGAITIGSISLIYTSILTNELKNEEEHKVELWAKATKLLVTQETEDQSMNLTLEVLKNNNTVPVLLVDADDNIYHYRNIDVPENNKDAYLLKQLEKMKSSGKSIEIDLGGGEKQYLYYKTSTLLVKLTWFPLVQLVVIVIFVVLAYWAFSNERKAEQDQVWVGMAKETAHQLGTPITSLMGWADVLEMKNIDEATLTEVKNDVARLQNIADRFSKIGSKPVLKETDIQRMLNKTIEYFRKRVSDKVVFKVNLLDNTLVLANEVLLEWVFENLIKNAIDAIEGNGEITIGTKMNGNHVCVDVKDNGRGIAKGNHKMVFNPGFTTKKRGWGLGLTLTKRIVEEYHQGKIFVKESDVNKGTTFRVQL